MNQISRVRAVAAPDSRLPALLLAAVAAIALLLQAFAAHAREAPTSFADLAEKLLPAVVNISTTRR